MTKTLVIQSIGSGDGDLYQPFMELQEPVHRKWAANIGADYLFWRGNYENANPTWNRFPMMLEAFAKGYEKVAWLDADTLVVKPDRDIFAETPDDVPLIMTRVFSTRVTMGWKDERFADPAEREWDVYNDGVLVVNRMPDAIEAIEFAWSKRRTAQEPWHVQGGMWELNWLLDWVYDHPDHVAELDFRWNWQPFDETYEYVPGKPGGQVVFAPAVDEACLLAWHGHGAYRAWPMFKAAYDEHYGA